jgi:molecular chaperone GrpE
MPMSKLRDEVRDRDGGAADEPIATEEVERPRRSAREQEERHLRLRADFENLRRRIARENDQAREEGRRSALLPLLGVLDTLERALAAGSADQGFYEGVVATHRLFLSALREAGATPVPSEGERFDPTVHEAVATEPSSEDDAGTVLREVRRGCRLGAGSLLRPAQVVVAAGPGG